MEGSRFFLSIFDDDPLLSGKIYKHNKHISRSGLLCQSQIVLLCIAVNQGTIARDKELQTAGAPYSLSFCNSAMREYIAARMRSENALATATPEATKCVYDTHSNR